MHSYPAKIIYKSYIRVIFNIKINNWIIIYSYYSKFSTFRMLK